MPNKWSTLVHVLSAYLIACFPLIFTLIQNGKLETKACLLETVGRVREASLATCRVIEQFPSAVNTVPKRSVTLKLDILIE
jgi:hypothetical protein